MLRATYLFVFGILITFTSLAFCQETSIENALRISKRTGKPIFAIASRKICPPCQILKSRVSNHFQNSHLANQVVYLRVDLDEPQWGEWSRRFPHQGRMIPLVYLIRADEKQLYGQSNTLPGDQLEKFISQGVAHSGRSFTNSEIKTLESANQSARKALANQQLDAALKWLNTSAQYGSPGNLNSYATLAIENKKIASQIASQSVDHVKKQLNSIQKQIAAKDTTKKFAGVQQFVQLEKTFGSFEGVSELLSPLAVNLAIESDLRVMWKEARVLRDAQAYLVASRFNKTSTQVDTASLREIAESGSVELARKTAIDLLQIQIRIAGKGKDSPAK